MPGLIAGCDEVGKKAPDKKSGVFASRIGRSSRNASARVFRERYGLTQHAEIADVVGEDKH